MNNDNKFLHKNIEYKIQINSLDISISDCFYSLLAEFSFEKLLFWLPHGFVLLPVSSNWDQAESCFLLLRPW